MDRAHLTKLYTTAEFADCVIVSAQNQKFKAHRFVLSQYPHLTELLDDDDRIHLTESTEVTERLLRWIYGVDWPEIDVQPTRLGVGKELMDIMSLCDAAQKYDISKLGDEAYGAVGRVLGQITTAEVGLHVLRDLTDQDSGAGALQRTIIDRIISLLPREASSAGAKRKKKPTAKAKESASPPRMAPRKSAPAFQPTPARKSSFKLYCICKKPEDPFLVECEDCQRWFHPGCVGKGKYKDSTYKHARKIAQAGDEKMYREKNLRFTCTRCDRKRV